MPVVKIRDLARHTSRVVGDVARTKRPALVTRSGRPIAVVSALDADGLEDWVLANAPEFVRSLRGADEDLAGRRTISLEDFLARPSASRRDKGRARRASRKT